MAAGPVTTSRIRILPPHLEQTVTSMAKTRASRLAQPYRRGVAVASRSSRSPAWAPQQIRVMAEQGVSNRRLERPPYGPPTRRWAEVSHMRGGRGFKEADE
jgi:hypothetical protein